MQRASVNKNVSFTIISPLPSHVSRHFSHPTLSAMEVLVELELYLTERNSTSGSRRDLSVPADRPPVSSTCTATTASDEREQRHSRTHRLVTRLTNHMTEPHKHHGTHHGLSKRLVVPAIMIALALVFAMCGSLAALTQGCQEHWVGRWCVYQSVPLLTVLPGSPSACACAVLYVRGPAIDIHTVNSTSPRLPCNEDMLTQLHGDFNEHLHVSEKLISLVHDCPMQNITQTTDILATKMDSLASIRLRNSVIGFNATVKKARLNMRDLKTKNLLAFNGEGVPFTNPSNTTFKVCTKLVDFNMKGVGWTSIPNGAFSTMTNLVSIHMANNKLVEFPSLEASVKLQQVFMSGNMFHTVPSLETNIALQMLYVK